MNENLLRKVQNAIRASQLPTRSEVPEGYIWHYEAARSVIAVIKDMFKDEASPTSFSLEQNLASLRREHIENVAVCIERWMNQHARLNTPQHYKAAPKHIDDDHDYRADLVRLLEKMMGGKP